MDSSMNFSPLMSRHSAMQMPGGRTSEPLLTQREVCAYLRISMPTLLKLRKQGLPSYQLTGQPRFLLSEIMDYLGK